MALIVLRQIAVMFLLILGGFYLYKRKLITDEGTRLIGNILVYLSLPCTIFNGFLVERTQENVEGLVVSAMLAFCALMLSLVVSALIFHRDPMAAFACTFPNPAFFGLPIITAIYGESAVFYMAGMITFMNLTQWSYGVNLLQLEDRKGKTRVRDFFPSPGRIFRAPFFIAAVAGIAVFALAVPIPSIIRVTLSSFAAVNTPLAMVMIGCYVAQMKFSRNFTNFRLYLITAVRMVLIPLLVLLLLKFVIPIGSTEIRIIIFICLACPVGTNIAVYAGLYDKDYRYAVETIINSTLFSIVTVPLLVRLAETVL